MSPRIIDPGRVAASWKQLHQYVTDDHIVFRITLVRYSVTDWNHRTSTALWLCAGWCWLARSMSSRGRTVRYWPPIEQCWARFRFFQSSHVRVSFIDCSYKASPLYGRHCGRPVRLDRSHWSINAPVMERPASCTPSLLLKHSLAVISCVHEQRTAAWVRDLNFRRWQKNAQF